MAGGRPKRCRRAAVCVSRSEGEPSEWGAQSFWNWSRTLMSRVSRRAWSSVVLIRMTSCSTRAASRPLKGRPAASLLSRLFRAMSAKRSPRSSVCRMVLMIPVMTSRLAWAAVSLWRERIQLAMRPPSEEVVGTVCPWRSIPRCSLPNAPSRWAMMFRSLIFMANPFWQQRSDLQHAVVPARFRGGLGRGGLFL